MENITFKSSQNTNFVFNNKYNNMQCGKTPKKQLLKDTAEFSSKQKKEKIDYSTDDGKISFSDKIKNFAKGIISPITTLFSSPKNFVMGVGIIAAGSALMIATGGALAPVLVGLGLAGGTVQLGISIYKASKATTDEEAKNAWQGIGSGTSNIALSVTGAKASLKAAGVDTSNMNCLKATVECFKQIPLSIKNSVNAFTSGQALTNIKNAFNIKPKSNSEKLTPEEIKAEAESRIRKENTIAENCRKNDQAIQEMQNPSSTSAELQAHPELQNEHGGYSAEASARFFEENGLTETEIKLNQKLESFRAKIDAGTIHFHDDELAVKAYDELLSKGYDVDQIISHYTDDIKTIQKIENHDLKISTINDTLKGKGIKGFHVKEGYDALFEEAARTSGNENNAKPIVESFLAEDSKGNFKHSTITVSNSPDLDRSIVIDVKRNSVGCEDTSLIITRETDSTVSFHHICQDGTIEQIGVKTLVNSKELENVFSILKQKGITVCRGANMGELTNGFIFEYNGQYYHGQISKTTTIVTSIFPITKEAAKQKKFILDLVPIIE